MPLFTFLSGYVYAFRPFTGHTCQFIKSKARRLLLPMLVAGTLFAIIQSLTPGANGVIENWALLHIILVAHFWFVEALFLIFIGIAALENSNFLPLKQRLS
jgi:fucose 4-O-acetylase-like acetyltransferase